MGVGQARADLGSGSDLLSPHCRSTEACGASGWRARLHGAGRTFKGDDMTRAEHMRERWRDPVYRAEQTARMKARFEDPMERVFLKWQSQVGAKASADRHRLPAMSDIQRRLYEKLRSKRFGWSRDRALAAVLVVMP